MGEDAEATREHRLVVPPAAAGERLDRWLAAALAATGTDLSRAAVQELVKSGAASVGGRTVKPSHPVAAGDEVFVRVEPERSAAPRGEEIPLSILFEDDDLIVVDKPPGLVVHPAAGNPDGTLVNALLHHCQGNLCALAGADRPGIVHRLDKETSGCLVAAKSEAAYHSLVAQFSGRETEKEYLAVTEGIPSGDGGTIVTNIGRHPVNRQKMAVVAAPAGKEAVTDYRVLRCDPHGGWAVLQCVIHTGRTHQIRVHLKEVLRRPILGDTIYAQVSRQKTKVERLMLHARGLGFRHPVSGEFLRFEAPMPEAFRRFV
jgi:23S rRNA pseudouridine1911/1915/1917 synthase